MADDLKIKVNGRISPVAASPDTPLLYVLTNELKLWGPRFGCGLAQCGSCSVLADGVEIRSCVTPVGAVADKSLTTFEGLAALVRASRRDWRKRPRCIRCSRPSSTSRRRSAAIATTA